MKITPILALSICLLSCSRGAESSTPSNDEAKTPAESPTPSDAPVVAQTTVTDAAQEPEAPANETVKPEPEPKPVAANVEPATLNLAYYRRCGKVTVSTTDDQTFVHYRSDGKGTIHRMDERAGILDTIPFDEHVVDPLSKDESNDFTRIEGIKGHWPDQVFMIVRYDDREFYGVRLFRFRESQWKEVNLLGKGAEYKDAWPWYDRSLLALAYNSDEKPRLGVVRGAPKAPSLEVLKKAKGCGNGRNLGLRHIEAYEDGRLDILASCKGNAWLAHWEPGERDGTVTDVGRAGEVAPPAVALGKDGTGFMALADGLVSWDGTKAEPIEGPPGKPPQLVWRGADGQPWARLGKKAWQRIDDRWVPLPVPEGATLAQIAGVEHGTPWMRFKKRGVSMQTTDGAWHEVELSATPDLDRVPRARHIHVSAPGDVWVVGKYFKDRWAMGETFNAVYTTRNAAEPKNCGKIRG